MSLLMDALRRAEQAKEHVRTEPGAEHAPGRPDGPGHLTAVGSAASADSTPVKGATAGGELSLSIDEVTPAAVETSRPAAGDGSTPDPRPIPQSQRVNSPAARYDQPMTHEQARRMLALKAQQSRRRRLGYIAGGGVSVLIVVLALVYFKVVVSTNKLDDPQIAMPIAVKEITEPAPADEALGAGDGMPATTTPAGTETASAGDTGAPAATPAHLRRDAESPSVPGSSRRQESPVRDEPAAAPVVIVRTEVEDPLQLLLTRAFEDYQSGNDLQAEAGYRQALARDANNRDALLGLAAVAQRGGRVEEARQYYRRLLELNPLDSAPAAGLIGLQGGADPVQEESRIKLLLRQEPVAAHLHFALGTLYVAQARWPEAQQAFFDAYRHDAENADYAFNLAVCLDRLGQRTAAMEYYRRAVDLARTGAGGFDAATVLRRIETLSAAAPGEPG
jgi:Tfp pilus assembly protein PilF